jgi:ATP-dependent Clp protease ATP-binding subunit ClpA
MTSYNRYSHHARRAITHAGSLVSRLRHPRTDTAHLLVGVMLTEGSIGCHVLSELHLHATHAEPFLYRMDFSEADGTVGDSSMDIALGLAAEESTWLGHHYIGTEHILLGITRSNLGHASALLKLLEVSPEEVRRRVRHALSDGLSEFSLQLARRKSNLSELSRRVISAAEQMALAFDHPTIGIGHLLMVLLTERRSPMSALLWEAGLDESHLRWGLDNRDPVTLVNIDVVLSQALDAAERLGDHYTGTEHLMLMLTLDLHGRALLEKYGLSADALRYRLEAILSAKR